MTPHEQLRRYPLFALLSSRQLDNWISGSTEVAFQTGETIFQEGTPGMWAYLVLEGRVRVLATTKSEREASLGMLRSGQVFGEYALVAPRNNTATCRAASAVKLLRLPLPPLWPLVSRLETFRSKPKDWLRLHMLVNYLRNRDFLGFQSAPSGLKYLPHLQAVSFHAEHTIQAEGLSNQCWFYIEEGQAVAHSEDEAAVRQLGPGDCFGERALLGRPGLATVIATTAVRCQMLSAAAFRGDAEPDNPVSLQSFMPRKDSAFAWVGQQEPADCGLAAVAMLALSCGQQMSIEQLRRQLCPGERGTNLHELARLAHNIGLPCHAVRIAVEQWRAVALPAVARFRDGHFVVVHELSVDGAVVADPACGIVRMSTQHFDENCSGHALVLGQPMANGQAHVR